MYTEENEIDSGHGRIEERHCFAISSTYIDSAQDWRGANSVVMMNSKRWVEGALHTETRYYLSSLPPEAKSIGDAIRKHWSIENSLHWCLDVGLKEDACRIHAGNAAENVSILRHLSMNMIKSKSKRKGGIARKRKLMAIDAQLLESLLF